MESTGSSVPAADTKLQNSPAPSSPALSQAASSNLVQEMVPVPEGMFKCEHCSRTFTSARGRGGHRKAHKELRQIRHQNKIDKERRRLAPPAAAPQVQVQVQEQVQVQVQVQRFNSNYVPASSSRSGVVPLLAGRGAGGLAPAQPAQAPANGYRGTRGGGRVGKRGRLGRLSKVNQGETGHGIRTLPLLGSSTMPMFGPQTGGGTSGLAQPSFAAPAPAADGNGGTGDGVHLGRQQKDKPEVNQEDTADDGIDLTLRL